MGLLKGLRLKLMFQTFFFFNTMCKSEVLHPEFIKWEKLGLKRATQTLRTLLEYSPGFYITYWFFFFFSFMDFLR